MSNSGARNGKDRYTVYRKSNPNLGAAIYPSPTAGSGKVDGDTEDGLYPCKQCGAENHTHTTQSPGNGNDGDGGVQVAADENGAYDPSVTSGCVFCGSLNSR